MMNTSRCESNRFLSPMLLLAVLLPVSCAFSAGIPGTDYTPGPQSGDVYWEYVHVAVNPDNGDTTVIQGAYWYAKKFTINVPDLTHATKAEMCVEYWGGHAGTSEQRFVVNDSIHEPIYFPLPDNTPTRPECYLRNMNGNSSTEFPLRLLTEGDNEFEFFHSDQICHNFNHPQTYAYAAILRVYFDSSKVAHPTGEITSPLSKTTIGDFHLFTATAQSDAGIKSVDFIGYYVDFDWEGNGVYRQWHYQTQRGRMMYHVGSDETAPYAAKWDSDWVPDQPNPMKFMARIRDVNGYCYMTPEVTCVRLKRTGFSIKLGRAKDVPEIFWANNGARRTCKIEVPENIMEATTGWLMVPSWGARHSGEPGTIIKVNQYQIAQGFGNWHHFSYDWFPLWPPMLGTGSEATFMVTSATTHHPAEILWPGPAAFIKYPTPDSTYCDTCESGCRIVVNVPDPIITPAGTTFTDSITIEIAQTSPSCSVFYTVNGGLPTRLSTPYTGPFVVKETAIINARAYSCTKLDSSNVVSVTFNLDVPAPTIEPSDTTFKDSISVIITGPASAAKIYYTLDGKDPTRSSQEYDGPFVLTKSASVRARGYSENGNDSSEVTAAVFTYWEDLQPPQMSPRGGRFPDSVRVRLAGIDRACSLYFTMDGSEPTRSSAKYTGPFALKGGATVKARAYSCDFGDSSIVTSFEFQIDVKADLRVPQSVKVRRFRVQATGNRLRMSLPEAGSYAFKVFSANGRLLRNERIKGPGLFHLQAGSWSPGVYAYLAVSPTGRTRKGKLVFIR